MSRRGLHIASLAALKQRAVTLTAAALVAAAGGWSPASAEPAGAVGLGNTAETFIEDGVDKSPVRGVDAQGRALAQGLSDDASFQLPGYVDTLYNDPACADAGEDWITFRVALAEVFENPIEDEDTKAYHSWQFFLSHGFRKFKVLDKEANRCFLGVCAVLYHMARHRMLVEFNYHSAVGMLKSLDRFVASIHPSKFDEANRVGSAEGPIWPVSDALIGRLQRELAGLSRGRGSDSNCGSPKGCIDGAKPMHGNLFHVLPGDVLPPIPGAARSEDPVSIGNAFKIYVYDVEAYDELRVLAAGLSFCKDNQWGFEVLLHLYFLACDCRTDNPDEADFFFVPQYTACHLNLKTFDEDTSNSLFEKLVPKLKHFGRSAGRDHIFVWGGGFAVDGPFRNWRSYIADSVFLMTETEFWNPYKWQVEPNFHHAKDIVLPGRISIKEIKQHNELALPMEYRPYVGDFVGWNRPLHTAQGTAESPRQRLLKWAAKYPDMHIRQDVPYHEALEGSVQSRFCFVPRGKSAWSSRLFRTLFGKCVPVLLNDDYEVPFLSLFQDKDNWLIRWPMREVTDEFADLLRNFDIALLTQMVENAQEAKCWYVWQPPVLDASHWDLEEGDLNATCPQWRTRNAYLAVLSLLMQKKRATKSSDRTFYVPGEAAGQKVFFDDQFRQL